MDPIGPTTWYHPERGPVDVLDMDDQKTLLLDWAAQATWKELSLKRSGYAGLSKGLDYGVTLKYLGTLKHQEARQRMRSILQFGVWTPARAARVNSGTSDCIHCGHPMADVDHLWWHCPNIPRDLGGGAVGFSASTNC